KSPLWHPQAEKLQLEKHVSKYREAAGEIAREAGALLRTGFGNVGQIEHKGAIDLVTQFDRDSEALILRRLGEYFPSHAVRGEEGGAHPAADDNGFEWLVDPIDGTTNFAHGLPIFAVSIALLRRGRVIAGAVYDPLRDELFTAAEDEGSTLNDAPIRVSENAPLASSLLATGFPYDVRTNPDNNLDHYADFALRTRGVRRPGAAAIDLAWVGCGRLDGFWELRLNPWDVAAGALIVKEAGGSVTDLRGDDDWLDPANIVASNGRIHAEMLRVLREKGEAPRPAC
ncbi:MAG: inositol monophosphatase family protein, partial [Anaerolineales bacterium]